MTQNQNVKDVLKAAADVATTVIADLADGKVSLVEIIGLIGPLTAVAGIVPKLPLAKDEWVNADNESRADLVSYAQSVISFANAHTEQEVENVIGVLVYGGGFFAGVQTAA